MNDYTAPLNTILVHADSRISRPLSEVVKHLEHLLSYAVIENARIVLCDVVEPPSSTGDDQQIYTQLLELRLSAAKNVLEKVRDQFPSRFDIECLVLQGKPVVEVCRIVAARNIDLLVTLPLLTEAENLDSVAMHFVRKSSCPVWVARQITQRKRATIVVAVDRDIFPTSDAPRAMLSQLIDAAIGLAQGPQADIHVVHAWQPYGVELLGEAGEILSASDITDYIDSQRYAHTLWLEQLHEYLQARIATASNVAIESAVHLIEGAPSDVIPNWLVERDADVLIIGTLGSGATPGLLIGNTAETIISRTSLSLVAFKPEGFRSPLAQ